MDFSLPGFYSDAHVFGLGATEFRSLAHCPTRLGTTGLSGNQPFARKLITRSRPNERRAHAEMRSAHRKFPSPFEVLNLVTPCVIKHDASGNPTKRKFRIIIADARSCVNFKFAAETNSGAIA